LRALLTESSDEPSMAATSLDRNPRTSRRTRTARWRGGRNCNALMKASEMVFTQLAKRAVRPIWRGRQDVTNLDVAVGDDHAVDEKLGQLPSLLEGGGGQAGADSLAECLEPVGDSAEFQLLPGGGSELALLG
jgi:hypothetical protein